MLVKEDKFNLIMDKGNLLKYLSLNFNNFYLKLKLKLISKFYYFYNRKERGDPVRSHMDDPNI